MSVQCVVSTCCVRHEISTHRASQRLAGASSGTGACSLLPLPHCKPEPTHSPSPPAKRLTLSALRMAYHTAPHMLTASPAALKGSKMKSPKAKAPTMVMMAFLRLPAVHRGFEG